MSTILTDTNLPNSSVVAQKYKLVFLGDQSVGKTSIINRFIFDTFDGKDHVIKSFHIIINYSQLWE
mgnify:CR=1 FL=1